MLSNDEQHYQENDTNGNDGLDTPEEAANEPGSCTDRLNCSCIFQSQVMLLLWKNLKLKIRHPFKSLFWLLIPCIFSILMVLVRIAADKQFVPEPTVFPMHRIDEDIAVIGLYEKHVLYTPISNATKAIMELFRDNTFTDKVIGLLL